MINSYKVQQMTAVELGCWHVGNCINLLGIRFETVIGHQMSKEQHLHQLENTFIWVQLQAYFTTFVQHLYQTMIMAFAGFISHYQDVVSDDVDALIYGFKI